MLHTAVTNITAIMTCGMYSLFVLTVLSTVLAAPAERNISSSTGEITFQSAHNVYLTQNFPSLDGKCPCLQNQTRPQMKQLPETSDADSREIKEMLTTVVETQRDIQKKFEILSKGEEGKFHVHNQTIKELNTRLAHIQEKAQAIQGHIDKKGKTLHAIHNRSRADTEEMVSILSSLLETQRDIRTELHSLAEAEGEKTERQNDTMLSLNARLASIDENVRLNQIHNSKTEQNLNKIQRKLEYLYNQTINSMNIKLAHIDGKTHTTLGHIDQTWKTVNESRARSEDMVTLLSDLRETQRDIRTELHSVSEAEDEKAERHNETMLSLNARLLSIEIQNNETGKNHKEVQDKLDYLYNQSARISVIEEMVMGDKKVDEEQDRKLDQIIHLISNLTRETRGFSVNTNGGYPVDCGAVYNLGGRTTGVYKIKPVSAPKPVDVYCDMSGQTKWTVIMSRYDGSVSFDRIWAEYKAGFGDIRKEHWIGLDTIHYLTNQRQYKVRFEMREWQTRATKWAEFTTFTVGSESCRYILTISGESGTASRDRMNHHNNKLFTTKDKDHDFAKINCAVKYPGGWWFVSCYNTFLTGPYTNHCATSNDHKCMVWDANTPLSRAIVKIAQV